MKKYAQICLIALTLLAVGCKGGHSLVGKWTTSYQNQPLNIEFTKDSKLIATMDLKQPLDCKVTINGTYNESGDTFTGKVSDMTLKATDSSKQALIDSVMSDPKAKQKQIDDMNKNGMSGKLVWKSDDEVEVTDPKGTKQTFTRVKA